MSKIIENVWLGDANDALNDSFIRGNNINVVVNCTKDIQFYPSVQYKYRIPVNDDLQKQSFNEMYIAIHHIIPVLVKHVQNCDHILIHCYAGMQRSAIVTFALLTILTYNSYFKDIHPTEENIEEFCLKIKRYMSTCRPIVFTPYMNFKESYKMWLNDIIKTL